MVAMQVADKNMIYALELDFKFAHLYLCSFSAVYQKQALIYIEYLSA